MDGAPGGGVSVDSQRRPGAGPEDPPWIWCWRLRRIDAIGGQSESQLRIRKRFLATNTARVGAGPRCATPVCAGIDTYGARDPLPRLQDAPSHVGPGRRPRPYNDDYTRREGACGPPLVSCHCSSGLSATALSKASTAPLRRLTAQVTISNSIGPMGTQGSVDLRHLIACREPGTHVSRRLSGLGQRNPLPDRLRLSLAFGPWRNLQRGR